MDSKVFGIGLCRTGTTSLGQALNMLGIKTIHYPTDPTTLNELQIGKYNLTLMKTLQGLVDVQASACFPQLDEAFPNSKFILTVRDLDSWLDSSERHWKWLDEIWDNTPDSFKRMTEYIFACVYGSIKFNKERYSYVYNRHVSEVMDYFDERKDDLLVMDICGGDGWDKLCPFLNIPEPAEDFPYINKSSAYALSHTIATDEDAVKYIKDPPISKPEAYVCSESVLERLLKAMNRPFDREDLSVKFVLWGGRIYTISDDVAETVSGLGLDTLLSGKREDIGKFLRDINSK
ncbi:sulfotransferase family protein [Candidatus Poribacteria bacterium]